MCSESRGVPGTTICPIPATWSFTAFSQVMPRLKPKYFGDGAALIVRTGTTNRSPSTDASRPSPQYRTIGTSVWAAISAAFAAAMVSEQQVRQVDLREHLLDGLARPAQALGLAERAEGVHVQLRPAVRLDLDGDLHLPRPPEGARPCASTPRPTPSPARPGAPRRACPGSGPPGRPHRRRPTPCRPADGPAGRTTGARARRRRPAAEGPGAAAPARTPRTRPGPPTSKPAARACRPPGAAAAACPSPAAVPAAGSRRTPASTLAPTGAAPSTLVSPSRARNGRTVAYQFVSAARMATSAESSSSGTSETTSAAALIAAALGANSSTAAHSAAVSTSVPWVSTSSPPAAAASRAGPCPWPASPC